jgi:hypothetical protein
MKFLFAACLVNQTLPLYAETELADIAVTTDFPGGSAIVKSIDRKSGVIHITPKTQSERGWRRVKKLRRQKNSLTIRCQ